MITLKWTHFKQADNNNLRILKVMMKTKEPIRILVNNNMLSLLSPQITRYKSELNNLEFEKIEIEKTYWTLTANNPQNAEQAEDIKKLFLSAPGRPRQVPNIYFDKNDSNAQITVQYRFLSDRKMLWVDTSRFFKLPNIIFDHFY